MEFPLDFVRGNFPSLADPERVFFDNAAGSQVPRSVADAMSGRPATHAAVQKGSWEELGQTIQRARESVAVFLNAYQPEEILFGVNATGFIRLVSTAFGELLKAGEEIVVTELDHQANITPWLDLKSRGIEVKIWPVEADARLDIERLDTILSDRTRLVAVTKASNAVGTIVDLIPVAERIHARGGHLFVDAVHFASHGPLDVRFFGCDFLVCSGYKIFGPRMGFLWAKREALDALPGLRQHFVADQAPDNSWARTYGYRDVAGMDAAIGYIEELGRRSRELPLAPADAIGRRGDVRRGMQAIRHYERDMTGHLLRRAGEIPALKVHGIDGPDYDAYRTPTLCFSLNGMAAAEVSRQLAQQGIAVRDGHQHCPRLMRALGLSESEGGVRASLVHYNTFEEVDLFAEALARMSASVRVSK